MRLRRNKREPSAPQAAVAVQTSRSGGWYGGLGDHIPLATVQGRMYAALREAVPVIDAAIYKLIRLTGGFHIACAEPAAERQLARTLARMPVNGVQRGIEHFITCYFEQLLTYGTAAGEIVMGRGGQVCALYNVPLENLELRRGKSPLQVEICRKDAGGTAVPVPHPERVLLSVLHPEPGQLTGNSLLRGLPFVTDILLKVFHSVGMNWERVGNVRFAVTYKPPNDDVSRAYAKERAMQIAGEWASAMRDTGGVKDFVSVGDVSVRVIGAEGQIPDSEVPARQMLEQIVAKTGLPPFMLGLHWSSTERMSAQQADVLTSELEAYRRLLTPAIERIARACLLAGGYGAACSVVWDDITLQDEVELARARLYNAQADALLNKQNANGEEKKLDSKNM